MRRSRQIRPIIFFDDGQRKSIEQIRAVVDSLRREKRDMRAIKAKRHEKRSVVVLL